MIRNQWIQYFWNFLYISRWPNDSRILSRNFSMKMNFNRYKMLYLSNVQKKLKLERRSYTDVQSTQNIRNVIVKWKLFFSDTGEITVSTSNAHNHAHRVSTIRAPSPVRVRVWKTSFISLIFFCMFFIFFSYIQSYYLFLKLNKLFQAQNNG